jgi:thiamine biosynthesis lipoprotein ApbE
VLLLQVLLGLEPDRVSQTLETTVQDEIPEWAGSLRLSGLRAFGRSWDVAIRDRRVRVERLS